MKSLKDMKVKKLKKCIILLGILVFLMGFLALGCVKLVLCILRKPINELINENAGHTCKINMLCIFITFIYSQIKHILKTWCL